LRSLAGFNLRGERKNGKQQCRAIAASLGGWTIKSHVWRQLLQADNIPGGDLIRHARLYPGIHAVKATPFFKRLWASEATPFAKRLCPAMTTIGPPRNAAASGQIGI
jgi:hypothetical protein